MGKFEQRNIPSLLAELWTKNLGARGREIRVPRHLGENNQHLGLAEASTAQRFRDILQPTQGSFNVSSFGPISCLTASQPPSLATPEQKLGPDIPLSRGNPADKGSVGRVCII